MKSYKKKKVGGIVQLQEVQMVQPITSNTGHRCLVYNITEHSLHETSLRETSDASVARKASV